MIWHWRTAAALAVGAAAVSFFRGVIPTLSAAKGRDLNLSVTSIEVPRLRLGMTASGWSFTSNVAGAPVADSAGVPMPQAFLGGFDVPRPQLVDINGDGKPVLFLQERSDDLMEFEQHDGQWLLTTDHYQHLDVGEWFRFVDVDHDGKIDLLSELPAGYIRLWRNVGTKTAAKFVAVGDTIRDTDGLALIADRQNILNAVDIDCNGKLDLFLGRVQGTVDRYEEDATGPDGTPRFRLITQSWEGIEILGPESTMGTPNGTIHDTSGSPGGPHASALMPHALSLRHGANTLTFADVSGKGANDLYWGDFFEPGLLLIENQGTCAQPDFQTRPVEFPVGHPVITSGYNAPTFGDVDGDGRPDLIMGVIGGAYSPNRTSIDNLYLLTQPAAGQWSLKTKRLIRTIDVGSEATPVLADLRGTGKLDLLIGSKMDPESESSGSVRWFENVGTAAAPSFRDRGPLPIHGEYNYSPAVADLDGSGLPSIVVGTWRDRLEWYRNAGTRAEPRWTLADSMFVVIPRGSNTVPTFGDIDGDGTLELVIGVASGKLLLYKNVGTRGAPKFQLVTDHLQDIHGEDIKFGRRSAPTLVDLDGDGKPDLLIGNEAGELGLWRNVGTKAGEFRFERDTSFALQSYPDAAPAAGKLHGDHVDILVGTAAGGVRWFENGTARKP